MSIQSIEACCFNSFLFLLVAGIIICFIPVWTGSYDNVFKDHDFGDILSSEKFALRIAAVAALPLLFDLIYSEIFENSIRAAKKNHARSYRTPFIQLLIIVSTFVTLSALTSNGKDAHQVASILCASGVQKVVVFAAFVLSCDSIDYSPSSVLDALLAPLVLALFIVCLIMDIASVNSTHLDDITTVTIALKIVLTLAIIIYALRWILSLVEMKGENGSLNSSVTFIKLLRFLILFCLVPGVGIGYNNVTYATLTNQDNVLVRAAYCSALTNILILIFHRILNYFPIRSLMIERVAIANELNSALDLLRLAKDGSHKVSRMEPGLGISSPERKYWSRKSLDQAETILESLVARYCMLDEKKEGTELAPNGFQPLLTGENPNIETLECGEKVPTSDATGSASFSEFAWSGKSSSHGSLGKQRFSGENGFPLDQIDRIVDDTFPVESKPIRHRPVRYEYDGDSQDEYEDSMVDLRIRKLPKRRSWHLNHFPEQALPTSDVLNRLRSRSTTSSAATIPTQLGRVNSVGPNRIGSENDEEINVMNRCSIPVAPVEHQEKKSKPTRSSQPEATFVGINVESVNHSSKFISAHGSSSSSIPSQAGLRNEYKYRSFGGVDDVEMSSIKAEHRRSVSWNVEAVDVVIHENQSSHAGLEAELTGENQHLSYVFFDQAVGGRVPPLPEDSVYSNQNDITESLFGNGDPDQDYEVESIISTTSSKPAIIIGEPDSVRFLDFMASAAREMPGQQSSQLEQVSGTLYSTYPMISNSRDQEPLKIAAQISLTLNSGNVVEGDYGSNQSYCSSQPMAPINTSHWRNSSSGSYDPRDDDDNNTYDFSIVSEKSKTVEIKMVEVPFSGSQCGIEDFGNLQNLHKYGTPSANYNGIATRSADSECLPPWRSQETVMRERKREYAAYLRSLVSATNLQFRSIQFAGRPHISDLLLNATELSSHVLSSRYLIDQMRVDIVTISDVFLLLFGNVDAETLNTSIESVVDYVKVMDVLLTKTKQTAESCSEYFAKVKISQEIRKYNELHGLLPPKPSDDEPESDYCS